MTEQSDTELVHGSEGQIPPERNADCMTRESALTGDRPEWVQGLVGEWRDGIEVIDAVFRDPVQFPWVAVKVQAAVLGKDDPHPYEFYQFETMGDGWVTRVDDPPKVATDIAAHLNREIDASQFFDHDE